MQLVFVRKNDIFTWVVTTVEGGNWSHCAVVHDSDFVIHANPLKGTHRAKMGDIIASAADYAIVDVRGADEQVIYEYLEGRIGKGYDFAALPGLLFGKNWGMSDRDYCSELAANAAVMGGLAINRMRYRTGVQTLWEIATNEWDSSVLVNTMYREARA